MVSPVYELIKIIASVYQTGGDYFFRDLLPSVYPSPKQVKPKLKTAMRPPRVNIGIPPLKDFIQIHFTTVLTKKTKRKISWSVIYSYDKH